MTKTLRALACVLALTAAVAGCSKSSDSDPTTAPSSEVSRFVGLWHMSLKGNPGDPGLDWRFNDDNTVILYDTGSSAPKGSGTGAISGSTATGTWRINSKDFGRFVATLTGDDSHDFNFIEDKYTPARTIAYAATRLEPAPPNAAPFTPPPPGTAPPAAGVDEIPFAATDIVWDCPAGNVGAWAITSKITVANLTKGELTIVRDPMEGWPDNGGPKPAIGNWWIIGLCGDGKWHGGTVDWLGPGRTQCPAPKFNGHDEMGGQIINAWRPKSGDTAYVMQSTHARAGIEIPGNTQRTNIVKVIIP